MVVKDLGVRVIHINLRQPVYSCYLIHISLRMFVNLEHPRLKEGHRTDKSEYKPIIVSSSTGLRIHFEFKDL